MNKKQYMEYHAEAVARMRSITMAKNADYTGVVDDPFANFTKVEQFGICSTEQGFLTRMTDKMSRLVSFVQKGVLEVKDESLEDTCLDLANYLILFAAYVKSQKQSKTDGLIRFDSSSSYNNDSVSSRAAHSRAP